MSFSLNHFFITVTFSTQVASASLTMRFEIVAYFAYKYMNHNKENVARYDYVYQATHWYKWEISKKLTLKTDNIIFGDMINIKDFDSSLLKIGKKSYKNIGSCNIGYTTIHSVIFIV